ncbi:hypothetical protein P148_SR1C00001G0212 [candidate division SR1 bacterium RAAC1_SR1_1]|nr:hypothetical protein P148_SR1C00001G0212 [candidate division SR1 bacterium RAAC1_SR1_1]
MKIRYLEKFEKSFENIFGKNIEILNKIEKLGAEYLLSVSKLIDKNKQIYMCTLIPGTRLFFYKKEHSIILLDIISIDKDKKIDFLEKNVVKETKRKKINRIIMFILFVLLIIVIIEGSNQLSEVYKQNAIIKNDLGLVDGQLSNEEKNIITDNGFFTGNNYSNYTGSMFIRDDNTCDLLYSGDYKELIIRENFNTPSLETLRSTDGYLSYSKEFEIPKGIEKAWLCIESDFNEIGNSKKNYATTYFFIGKREYGGHINVSYSDEYNTLYGDGRFRPKSSSRQPKGPKIYFESLDNIKVYNSTIGNHTSLGNVYVNPIEMLKDGGKKRIGGFVDSMYQGGVIKVFKIFYK